MTWRAHPAFTLLFCGLCVFAVPSFVTRPAQAGEDAMIEMARERFQEGVKYYDEKQYEKARAAFLQAYALKRHPAVLLNLAQSELRSGHEADSAKHFATYLREHKEASALEKQEAEKGLAASKTKVTELTLTADADGAEVFVDGQPEGRTPLPGPLFLEPGNHSIEARKEGKTASTSVTAKAGAQSSATLSFAGASAATGAAAGTAAGPGETPPGEAGSSAPAGEEAPADTGTYEVDTSGPREPFFSWAKRSPVAWIGAIVTVGGIAAGTALALSSRSAFDSADSVAEKIRVAADEDGIRGPCVDPQSNGPRAQDYVDACQKYDDNVEAGDQRKLYSTVSFVVAGVALAGTIVYYFVSSKPKTAETVSKPRGLRAQVVPVAGPGFQGVSVVGAF